MRSAAGLALVVLLAAGCWNWSFPTDLLADGPGPDSPVADLRVDGGQDFALDLEPDLIPDQAPPECPPCTNPATPICDKGKCRPCDSDGECLNGFCNATGECPAASDIAHVNSSSRSCPGNGDKATPFCAFVDGADSGKAHVLVEPGNYDGDVTLDAPQEIHGKPGAILKVSACDKLLIEKAKVTLVGFTIEGSIKIVSGTGVLLRDRIGPSACIGVEATGELTLERSFIFGHDLGGVHVKDKYSLVNNIIAQNGTPGGPQFGAIKLEVAPSGSRLMYNTIAFNQSKGGAKEGAIRCEAAAAGSMCVNCLFWGNTPNDQGYPMGPNCNPLFSIEDYKSPASAPSHTSNFTVTDPKFVSLTPGTDPADYHIQPTSPARDKGNPLATGLPADDYDGDPRSDGQPDIGADEI